ncbi:MAG: manganese efflux pump [Eubacterium sp.]
MFFNIIVLVSALCIDIFVASIAYGTNQVLLTRLQILISNAICSLCLGVSLLFGTFLDSLIPETFTKEICFFSLLFLGIIKLSDFLIKRYVRKHKTVDKKIHFGFSNLKFIIKIYCDPLEADADQNKKLSLKEVIFFSLAMSIDSLIAGTMAAFLKISVSLTILTAFAMGSIFTCLGQFLGHKISSKTPVDLSWIGGILFIILAFSKL